MTDNVPVTSGAGELTSIACDDISNVQYQRVKVVHGADGINDGDVSTANPLPARIYGTQNDGSKTPIPCDEFGHMEVSLHGPRLPFGAIHTESLTPIVQIDGVYGINTQLIAPTVSGSGATSGTDAMMQVSSGTTIYSTATLQSRRRIRYRPGQGSICRFTQIYQPGVANCYQVAGMGHAEDGFYFAYVGTAFGILHSSRGVREVQTLSVSTGSSTAESVTITLAGTAHTVAVTNSASANKTAYEISSGTFAGWQAEAVGATVIFLSNSAGNKTGTFSLVGTTAVGSFAETRAGVASTDVFIPQTSWNVDTMDGNGPSGVTLDQSKGNVYQIEMEYLGFGAVVFKMETNPSGNNAIISVVHQINYVNQNIVTSVANPSFPFTMAVSSAGSTTNVTMKCGSAAGFIGGQKYQTGPRLAHSATVSSVGAVNYAALFTVRNTRYFNGKANQSVINLNGIAAAAKHTQPVTLYVIRNGVLGGTPNFVSSGGNSCSYLDTAATTVTPINAEGLILAIPLAETGQAQIIFEEDMTLQPGEWITVCAKSASGSASYVSASLNTREDH